MIENQHWERQRELQLEADEVAQELALDNLLSAVGTPVRVGSSALGLMVWRDLDITVVCSTLSLHDVARIASNLVCHRGVRELRFVNDSGDFRKDEKYPDGLYLGLKYASSKGMDWKVDIWFVDEPEKQPDITHLKTIPARLTSEKRASILAIKSVWAIRDEYGRTVRSYDIYSAVLDGGVRTPAEFDEWLRNKNLL